MILCFKVGVSECLLRVRSMDIDEPYGRPFRLMTTLVAESRTSRACATYTEKFRRVVHATKCALAGRPLAERIGDQPDEYHRVRGSHSG